MADVAEEMDLQIEAKNQREMDLARMRHSASHVMAQAVLENVPDAKQAHGPALDLGLIHK
jgi:threonyl-tRNA synthetase